MKPSPIVWRMLNFDMCFFHINFVQLFIWNLFYYFQNAPFKSQHFSTLVFSWKVFWFAFTCSVLVTTRTVFLSFFSRFKASYLMRKTPQMIAWEKRRGGWAWELRIRQKPMNEKLLSSINISRVVTFQIQLWI